MILAHLSELHLGHRAFGRVEGGRNAREGDVVRAFHAAIQEVVRLGPDLVVMAGDVFDRPDPPSSAYVALARGLEALRKGLPDTPVVMVAGARDTPRRPGEPGPLAAIDSFPGVEAASGTARSVSLMDGELHVLLLPYRSALRPPFPKLRPDPDARWNVLVAHAEVGRSGRGGIVLDRGAWDYVALGSRHVRTDVSEGVIYAGSLERIGTDPWEEVVEEKGFVTWDLETRRTAFHPVPVRPVVSLAPTPVRPTDLESLNARIREVLDEVPGGIDGKVVRLHLRAVPRAWLGELDREVLVRSSGRALHLALVVEESEVLPPVAESLEERLRRHLSARLGEETRLVDRLLRAADPLLHPRTDGPGVELELGDAPGAP